MKTTDKGIKQLAQKAYPDYKGRKFFVEAQKAPLDVRSSWQDGSRDYFTFVRLADMDKCQMPAQSGYERPIGGMEAVIIPAGFVCVRRSFYCGTEGGLTVITANPELGVAAKMQRELESKQAKGLLA